MGKGLSQELRPGNPEAVGSVGEPEVGGCWPGGAEFSAGGLVDLLVGGDDLAILDLFHNGTHLARGHGCRRQTLGGRRWLRNPPPVPSPPCASV